MCQELELDRNWSRRGGASPGLGVGRCWTIGSSTNFSTLADRQEFIHEQPWEFSHATRTTMPLLLKISYEFSCTCRTKSAAESMIIEEAAFILHPDAVGGKPSPHGRLIFQEEIDAFTLDDAGDDRPTGHSPCISTGNPWCAGDPNPLGIRPFGIGTADRGIYEFDTTTYNGIKFRSRSQRNLAPVYRPSIALFRSFDPDTEFEFAPLSVEGPRKIDETDAAESTDLNLQRMPVASIELGFDQRLVPGRWPPDTAFEVQRHGLQIAFDR